MEMNRELPD